MATLDFYKYHGTGNDFILVDARSDWDTPDAGEIASWCHRRFGIGADGMMLLLPSEEVDFEMKYFNSDGNEGSMCGNGGRCIAAFAFRLGIAKESMTFRAIDGLHRARIKSVEGNISLVEISMNDVLKLESLAGGAYVLDTGSPHYVEFVDELEKIDAFDQGKKIRWDDQFKPGGINANFVEKEDDALKVVTFERGVEDITLSCGTGVTASAIAASAQLKDGSYYWKVTTQGGKLSVSFEKRQQKYTNICLYGPAEMVFSGTITR